MICFAFGAKWGPIARATASADAVPAASAALPCAKPADASRRSSMSEASASDPMPKPAWRKKWRRVRSRRLLDITAQGSRLRAIGLQGLAREERSADERKERPVRVL